MNEPYVETIRKCALFSSLTEYGAQVVLEAGTVKEHAAGEVLFKEGDPSTLVVVVLSGKLRVFVARDGRELTIAEPGPGTLVGELGVLCGIPRTGTLRVLEKSSMLHIADAAFRSLLLRDVSLSQRVFSHMAQTLLEKERALIDAAVRSEGKPR